MFDRVFDKFEEAVDLLELVILLAFHFPILGLDAESDEDEDLYEAEDWHFNQDDGMDDDFDDGGDDGGGDTY